MIHDYVNVFRPTAEQEHNNRPLSPFHSEPSIGLIIGTVVVIAMLAATVILFVQGLGA